MPGQVRAPAFGSDLREAERGEGEPGVSIADPVALHLLEGGFGEAIGGRAGIRQNARYPIELGIQAGVRRGEIFAGERRCHGAIRHAEEFLVQAGALGHSRLRARGGGEADFVAYVGVAEGDEGDEQGVVGEALRGWGGFHGLVEGSEGRFVG